MPVVERGRPNAPELSSGTPVGAAVGPRVAPLADARARAERIGADGGGRRARLRTRHGTRAPSDARPGAAAARPGRRCAPSGDSPPTRGGPLGSCAARAAAGSSAENVLDGRRTAMPPAGPGLEGAPACSRRVFSARIFSSTGWLAGVSLSKRTPMPGVTPARVGSFSRIHTIVPSPASKGAASCSWKSKRSCVPTGSGSRVRMKMPPRLTSTA